MKEGGKQEEEKKNGILLRFLGLWVQQLGLKENGGLQRIGLQLLNGKNYAKKVIRQRRAKIMREKASA